MTKIYTKRGDEGKSSLPNGPIIAKSNPVFALMGQIDQVNACIGLLRSEDVAEYGKEMLMEIQRKLMALGSIVAGVDKKSIRDLISAQDVTKLEEEIDEMTQEMPELRNFILPNGSRKSALAHLIRSEIRTLERRIVGYGKIEDKNIVQWINRLSDFFFTLARYFNYNDQIDEIIW